MRMTHVLMVFVSVTIWLWLSNPLDFFVSLHFRQLWRGTNIPTLQYLNRSWRSQVYSSSKFSAPRDNLIYSPLELNPRRRREVFLQYSVRRSIPAEFSPVTCCALGSCYLMPVFNTWLFLSLEMNKKTTPNKKEPIHDSQCIHCNAKIALLFKFCTVWTRKHDFLNVIKIIWPSHGYRLSQIVAMEQIATKP